MYNEIITFYVNFKFFLFSSPRRNAAMPCQWVSYHVRMCCLHMSS